RVNPFAHCCLGRKVHRNQDRQFIGVARCVCAARLTSSCSRPSYPNPYLLHLRHFIMHVHHVSYGSARRLTCWVRRSGTSVYGALTEPVPSPELPAFNVRVTRLLRNPRPVRTARVSPSSHFSSRRIVVHAVGSNRSCRRRERLSWSKLSSRRAGYV